MALGRGPLHTRNDAPAWSMTCTSRRVLLRSDRTCNTRTKLPSVTLAGSHRVVPRRAWVVPQPPRWRGFAPLYGALWVSPWESAQNLGASSQPGPSPPPVSVGEPEHLGGVVLEDQGADVVLDLEIGEVGAPPVGGDDGEVRPEQHLAFEQRVGRLHQLRREVLRRPPGQVDVDIRLVGGDRD